MKKDIIIGIGEVLWDVFPEGKKIGGAPANFAYHVSQLGFDGRVVSAIGDDNTGKEIVEVFDRMNLNYHISSVDFPTGTVQVSLDNNGIPCYEIKENVAWDNIPFNNDLKELAWNTRAICFGTLAQRNVVSRNTINRFLDMMPDPEKCIKIFDINLRQHFYTKEVINQSLDKANILKINDEELIVVKRMFGYPDMNIENLCTTIIKDFNLKILILTCGTDGSYVFTSDIVSFRETPFISVVDTVGAGDSFTAAFCASLLKGNNIADSHQIAVEISAYICTQSGAMPELPDRLK